MKIESNMFNKLVDYASRNLAPHLAPHVSLEKDKDEDPRQPTPEGLNLNLGAEHILDGRIFIVTGIHRRQGLLGPEYDITLEPHDGKR